MPAVVGTNENKKGSAMVSPKKHSELIKAWADGARIQVKDSEGWHDTLAPQWAYSQEYRVKPEEPAKQEVEYPKTRINSSELERMFYCWDGTTAESILHVVNYALQHAVEEKQLFTKAQLDEAWNKGLNEALRNGPRDEGRDLKIAQGAAEMVYKDIHSRVLKELNKRQRLDIEDFIKSLP